MKQTVIKLDSISKPEIRTVYPDVKLSFNEISMHIRNEIMKSYQQNKR